VLPPGCPINLAGWIGTLVATAKQNRRGWFVCGFRLNGPGELIYLIASLGRE